MGVPLYIETQHSNEYSKFLQTEIFNGRMFVETIETDGQKCLCLFSSISNFEYLFWKQHPLGNINLQVLNDKSKETEFVTGCLTRIGEMFCESINQKKTLVSYFNETIIN
jgi:hypothetical protein